MPPDRMTPLLSKNCAANPPIGDGVTVINLLQEQQSAVFLDEVVTVFSFEIALRLIRPIARKKRNNAPQTESHTVSKSAAKPHLSVLVDGLAVDGAVR